MADKKLVVQAVDARWEKKSLGGVVFNKPGLVVTYPCPRCKASLKSKGEIVAAGDSCPNCQAAYDFDEKIKQAYLDFQMKVDLEKRQRDADALARVEKLAQERQQQAEKLEEQALLARARAEQERIAAAAARVSKRRQLSTSEGDLTAVENGYGFIITLLGLTLSLAFFGLIGAFAVIANSSNGAQADLGVGLLLFVLGAGVSLICFWWMVFLLVSMHRLLFRILEELLIQNKDRQD